YSTLYVTAGFASVLNAATPICAALVALVWLGVKINRTAMFGLMVGISGVIVLVWEKIGFSSDTNQLNTTLAILAGLGGAFSYGIAANMSKIKLAGISPTVSTVATQLGAALILLPLAIYWWPSSMPSLKAWINVVVLAVVCTGFAQILYFKLIEETGAANATTVTFLIPIFGLVWGNLFLAEVIPLNTIIACVVILLGVSLTTGILRPKHWIRKFRKLGESP
ncbi:MAG: DMT family transporter, partial [Kangiellaceae bacterium]|nr:DMT family transporter [Kangiellaceae bacterium]